MRHAILIGAGINGLVAGLFLRKAGFTVSILEAKDQVGGLAASDEFYPGYYSLGTLHDTHAFRPWVSQELGLAKHGLRFEQKTTPLACHADGAEPIYIDGRRLHGAASPKDQSAFDSFNDFIEKIAKPVRTLLDKPALNPLGSIMPMIGPMLGLRRVGSDALTELMRVGSMPVADWMRDRFKNERIMAALAYEGCERVWSAPRSPWTGLNLILSRVAQGRDVRGGAPALLAALVSAAQNADIEIRTGTKVEDISIQNAQVQGVRLKSGELVKASVVLSSCDPKHTLLRLVHPRHMSPTQARQIENIRTRGTMARLELALNGIPEDVSGQAVRRLRTGAHLDELEKAFDPIKYGRMSERPVIDVRVHTDEKVCPQGHSVLSANLLYVPENLEGGWSDAARDELLNRSLAVLRSAMPGIQDHIVGHRLRTPNDLSKDFGLSGGHLFHGESAPDQLIFMRPTPELAHYRTSIAGLYLGGSGSHPGGGHTGVPGALAAKSVISEF